MKTKTFKEFNEQTTTFSLKVHSGNHAFFCSAHPQLQEKIAVLIIGMPRSGSSCATGILHIMGLYLSEPLKEPNPSNPKGFFEHVPTLRLNNEILKSFGTCVMDTRPLNVDFMSPLAQEQKDKIQELLLTYFTHSPLFGIKDCRLTLLLPLYIQALTELGYTIKIIAALRKTEEIAGSLNTFNNMPEGETFELANKFFLLIDQYKQEHEIFRDSVPRSYK